MFIISIRLTGKPERRCPDRSGRLGTGLSGQRRKVLGVTLKVLLFPAAKQLQTLCIALSGRRIVDV
jgi:hypothetical protein